MAKPRAPALAEAIGEACATHSGRLAVADEGESLSYAELDAAAAAIAAALGQRGLQADEPVMVAVSNRARDLAAFLGVWRAGGVVVPVHRRALDATARDLIDRTGCRVVVNARPELETAPALRTGADAVGQSRSAPPPHRPLLEGAALIVFTSGTTGDPKGVVLSHDRYARKLASIDAVLPFDADDRVLLVLQLVFAFAHWVSFLTLSKGGAVLFQEKFDRAGTSAAMAGQRPTKLPVVPTMLRQLLPDAGQTDGPRFSGQFISGGEPLPAALGRTVRTAWPEAGLWDVFGLTETCTSDFIVRADEYDEAAGTIGKPSPGVECRIAEPDGELQIRTPFVMRGYLDAPELTAKAFRDDWFRTGDLGRLRADGRVELIGRAKDLIVRGGNKIAPIEVERALLEHPEVEEALAAGAPDPLRGEAVHVLVVANADATLDPDTLSDWARRHLDGHKRPDRIIVGDRIPVGNTGKADRRALARMIAEGEL